MDNIERIQKTKYLVTSADVDFEEKIHVSALVNFLIQSSWRHAEHLSWGVNILRKHNLSWVLSGLRLKIDEYINWKEELTVETWPKGINRLFYLRDFLVYNKNNKVVARATSNWLMIDIEKRRPKLQLLENLDSVITNDKHAIQELVPALKFNASPSAKTDYEVRYTHIDVNQHLTTTGYINFVMNTFRPEFISSHRPSYITLNFLKEVVFGTRVSMLRADPDSTTRLFSLTPAEINGKPYFNCELKF
jgi:medium-chain acyl-[acyl-carrier-protein] hydrolase